jgi:sporulation protein YqfC
MGIRKRLADALELQHDVALNLPVLHLTGSERLLMENHRGLLEYGRGKIRIASTAGVVEIEGQDLAIKSVGRDEVLVTGNIGNIVINRSAVKP